MNPLIRLCLNRPLGALMIWAALIILALTSGGDLPLREIPRVEQPMVQVVTELPGYPPREVRDLITLPLEEALSSLAGIKEISSESRQGESRITLRFPWGTDMNNALLRTRQRSGNLRGALPSSAEPPRVSPIRTEERPLLEAAFFSDTLSLGELKELVNREVKTALQRIPGTASCRLRGGRDREILIEGDSHKLQARGMSLEDLGSRISEENRNAPGGIISQEKSERLIQIQGRATSPKEIEEIIILPPEGSPFPLSAAASVTLTQAPQEDFFLGGTPPREGILLEIRGSLREPPLKTAALLREELNRQRERLRGRAEILIIHDRSREIQKTITGLALAALGGSFLAFLLLVFFTGSLPRSALLGSAIPLSLTGSLFILTQGGYSLDAMTLSGLTLGIGMALDNSVVTLSTLMDHRCRSADEISRLLEPLSGSLISATLTTAMVFAPLFFLPGMLGALYRGLALAVCSMLFISLLISLTLIPVLYLFTQGKTDTPPPVWAEGLRKSYTGLCEKQKKLSPLKKMILTALLPLSLMGGLLLLPGVEKTGFPQGDPGWMTLRITSAPGRSLEWRKAEGQQILAVLNRHPAVRELALTGGFPEKSPEDDTGDTLPAGRDEEALEGTLYLNTAGYSQAADLSKELTEMLSQGNIQVAISSPENSLTPLLGMVTHRQRLRLTADNPEELITLRETTAPLTEGASSLPGTWQIVPPFGKPAVTLTPRRERMAITTFGLNEISTHLKGLTDGLSLPPMEDEGTLIPLRLTARGAPHLSARTILKSPLPSRVDNSAGPALEELVLHKEEPGFSAYLRHNREDYLLLEGPAKPSERESSFLKETLPQAAAADQDILREQMRSLILLFLLALALVFCILGAQFESLKAPLLILVMILPALPGSLILLTITGQALSLSSALGALVCLGLGVNNGILLLEKAYSRPPGGISEAAGARLIPILITTGTTLLALTPLLAQQRRSPGESALAAVIIGGLTASTLASLFLMPLLLAARGKSTP